MILQPKRQQWFNFPIFSGHDLLLGYESLFGKSNDRAGNTLTETDVSYENVSRYKSADFNGTTSLINTGSDFIGTKAITVCGWINAKSGGGNNIARVLENELFRLIADFNNKFFSICSNGTNYKTSEVNSYLINKLIFISTTRTSGGAVTLYIGDKSNAPALSGSNNQFSGTPAAGTTNVIIGNRSETDRSFDGNIPILAVYENILTLDEITAFYNYSKNWAK